MKKSSLKILAFCVCIALSATAFSACSKENEADATTQSPQNETTSLSASSAAETTYAAETSTQDDGVIDKSEAVAIADEAFESFDLSVVGNPDRETEFSDGEAVKQRPSDNDDGASADSQFADVQGKDVWVVKYYQNGSEMSFVYFVIDTESGDILDSGFMGD